MFQSVRTFRVFQFIVAAFIATIALQGAAKANDLSGYDKIYIAPVTIADSLANREAKPMPRRQSSDRPVSEKDLKAKAERLHKKLLEQLSDSKTIVEAPGDDVLTIEAEIVDLRSNRPTMADYRAQPNLSSESLYTGGATINFVFTVNGDVVKTMEEDYYGSFTDPFPTRSTWGDADDAIRRAARNVAKALN